MSDAQTALQIISWSLYLIGIIGYLAWRDRNDGGRRGNGYAVLMMTWMINGLLFYTGVLVYTFFGYHLLGIVGLENVTFRDWSAALRLHGAIAAILTMYAILKAGAGKWKLVS